MISQKFLPEDSSPIAMAHRGGDEFAPENTMEAFKSAYELGYRYFETDIFFTQGEELIVFHDEDLSRLTGRNGSTASLTKKERQTTTISGEPLVLFESLLTNFPNAKFNIEPKNDAAVLPLVKLIKKHKAEGRICIGSFKTHRVLRIRELLPEVCTAVTTGELIKVRLASWRPRSSKHFKTGQIAEVPIEHKVRGKVVLRLDDKFITAAHTRGIKVLAWTINEAFEMHRLLDLGVDGIITDKPRVLKQVLVQRGQWY